MADKISDSSELNVKKKFNLNLFIHLLSGGLALSFVFTMQAVLTNIPLIPKRFIVPFFVGTLLGYYIWKSKSSLIIKNEELTLEVEKRTNELKTANDNLIKEMEKTNKINVDLENMNNLMIGRELKMIELKKELDSKK